MINKTPAQGRRTPPTPRIGRISNIATRSAINGEYGILNMVNPMVNSEKVSKTVRNRISGKLKRYF